MDIPSAYLDRIHAILSALVITSTHFNQDGMVNDVVMMNGQLISFQKLEKILNISLIHL